MFCTQVDAVGLQDFADLVAAQFTAAGLIEGGMLERVKLHATLVNSKFAAGSRQTFNAVGTRANPQRLKRKKKQ